MLSWLPLLLPVQQITVPAPPPQSLVRIELPDSQLLAELLRADYDVPYVHPSGSFAQMLVDAQELADLRRAELGVEVLHPDLASYYAERLATGPQTFGGDLAQWFDPPFGQGGMGGYYTLDEVVDILDQMRAQYPNLVSAKSSIGNSLQGRDIWMVRISDDPDVDQDEPEVRYDCLHHAREPQGMQTTLWFMAWLLENYGSDPLATYLVDEREMYFIPVVNPDGYVYNQQIAPQGGGLWRKNRRNNGGGVFGVDLNRNYPFEWGADNLGSSPNPDSETYRGSGPASEPETQAMINFISSREFGAALSIHTFSNLWLSPFGYDEVLPSNYDLYLEAGERVTEVNGYPVGAVWTLLYFANGATVDYDHAVHGTLSFTPEIGSSSDGFWPPQSRIVPLAEENLVALQRTALSAGAWVYVQDSTLADDADGDMFLDPGGSGSLTLDLRNSGVEGTTTGVQVRLETASADLQPGSPWNGPALGSSESVMTSPVTFTIAPSATIGDRLDYEVVLAFDGSERRIPASIVVGTPRSLIADEAEQDFGWITGAPGDGAVTGIWEWADPIGTDNGGEPFAPGEDATPGSGHMCFVTGNGGGSAGNDDVDGGPTTLISPELDLGDVASATLHYQRWFANTGDDALELAVSNDGGSSWTTIDSFSGNQNEWTAIELPLSELVPLTPNMRLRWRASDEPNNSLVEAAVDDLRIEIFANGPRLVVYGRPSLGSLVSFNVSAQPGDTLQLYASRFPGNTTLPGVNGTLLLNPDTMFPIATGTIPGDGLFEFPRNLPLNPALIGTDFFFQAFVTSGGVTTLSNRDEIVFE